MNILERLEERRKKRMSGKRKPIIVALSGIFMLYEGVALRQTEYVIFIGAFLIIYFGFIVRKYFKQTEDANDDEDEDCIEDEDTEKED